MKKNIRITLKKDIEILEKISNILLRISDPEKQDFQNCIKKLNSFENDAFFLNNLIYYDLISLTKKLFLYIDRNKLLFNEYKYILYSVITNLEKAYIYFLNNNNTIDPELDKIILKNKYELEKIIESKNQNKIYYYIKITLDTNIPFFYLSRKMILINLLNYGKPYNYAPETLDDDSVSNFILEYRLDNTFNIYDIFEKIKKEDDAILNYEIHKLDSNNNLYNLRFYVQDKLNEHSCLILNNIDFKFIEIFHYNNYYDTYIESKNQNYLLKNLIKLKNDNILLVLLKKINDREAKIFLPSGLNINNIDKIKDMLTHILLDKNISNILYNSNIDFYGQQMLEYLRKKYNIEHCEINN